MKPVSDRPIDEVLELALVALSVEQKQVGLGHLVSADEVLQRYDFGFAKDFNSAVVRELEDQDLLRRDRTELGNKLSFSVKGLRKAEELSHLQIELQDLAASAAPAAGRYVQRDDNSAPFDEILESSREFSKSVLQNNEIDEEDRRIILAEIAVFESAISQPVVSIDALNHFMRPFLTWVMAKFAESAFSVSAEKLMEKLAHLIASS